MTNVRQVAIVKDSLAIADVVRRNKSRKGKGEFGISNMLLALVRGLQVTGFQSCPSFQSLQHFSFFSNMRRLFPQTISLEFNMIYEANA